MVKTATSIFDGIFLALMLMLMLISMSIVDVHVGFDFNVESYFDVDVVDVMFMLTYKLLIESGHLMLGSVLCLTI